MAPTSDARPSRRRRLARRLGAIAAALVLIAIVALVWLRNARSGLALDVPRTTPAGPDASVRVTFLGVSTLLIDDGETALMTDGFVTRPGLVRTLALPIASDTALVARTLARLRVTKLAAVIPIHSHYDHALDAPEIVKRTGALLVGSPSTANIGIGAGVPRDRIVSTTRDTTLTFGRFRVTLIRSAHSPKPNFPGDITEPIVPPAKASAYKMGECWSVLIEHDGHTMLVHGSPGFIPHALDSRHADVVYLGAATLGSLGARYTDDYWREVVSATGARRVIVVHWDDFWRSLDEPLLPLPRVVDDFEASMRELTTRGKATGVDVRVPVLWQATDPFALSAVAR